MAAKELSIQKQLNKRIHVVFKDDRKKIFPFLKIALGRSVRSSKEVAKLKDQDAANIMHLLNFFIKELDDSYSLSEVKSEMHRHYLWNSTKEQLRILCLMRKNRSGGCIARMLEVSYEWVSKIQFQMLAQGAYLGQFTHIESTIERFVREDADIRTSLKVAYCEDLELFAAKLSYRHTRMDRQQCFHLAAYYAREMIAKMLFGGNFEARELAV